MQATKNTTYLFSLVKAIEVLVTAIQEGESDTWSSTYVGVGRELAEKAAAALIHQKLFDSERCPVEVDGADVGWAVEAVLDFENQ